MSVIARANHMKTRGQVGVGGKGVLAVNRSQVIGRQIPAGPIGLAQSIAVIHRLDGPLNQVVVMVVGVGRWRCWDCQAAFAG